MTLFSVDFLSTPATLLADLNTQMANATDWSRPNAGSRPNTWKATTTRGADMVLDFNGAAISADRMVIQAYLSYDGTTLGTAAPLRYLRWGRVGGSTSKPIRVHLSVSKEHLYLEIEGPRYNELNNDNGNTGSGRRPFYIGDLVPYLGSGVDPNPAVILVGQVGDTDSDANVSYWYKVLVSKTIGGATWQPGWLATLMSPASGAGDSMNRSTADGNVYLAPYVYYDDVDGLRGRLANCFFAGWAYPQVDYLTPGQVVGSIVTYGGVKHRLRNCYRSHNGNGANVGGPFGYWPNNGGNPQQTNYSPMIAVPTL